MYLLTTVESNNEDRFSIEITSYTYDNKEDSIVKFNSLVDEDKESIKNIILSDNKVSKLLTCDYESSTLDDILNELSLEEIYSFKQRNDNDYESFSNGISYRATIKEV